MWVQEYYEQPEQYCACWSPGDWCLTASCHQQPLYLNSLWPSDAIWWHISGSTLAQVMACCLTALSHYLNQCWLIISKRISITCDIHWVNIKGWYPNYQCQKNSYIIGLVQDSSYSITNTLKLPYSLPLSHWYIFFNSRHNGLNITSGQYLRFCPLFTFNLTNNNNCAMM